MTSCSQSKYWTRPSDYQSKVQWNQSQTCSQEQSFVTIRKSRKGTTLNIPETFYTAQTEQSFIEKIPILPAGGCCDMEYVMRRQNTLKREVSTKHNMCYTNMPHCSPSVTINIGTSQQCNQARGVCQRNISYSTISINPTVVSEEPFQKKEVIPLGLYCCGNPKCAHVQSREQRVIYLDETEATSKPAVDEKGFVYVTKPPMISPLKECWKLFTCKRKRKQADTYMPSVMTRTEPKECKVCPKDEIRESDLFRTSRDQPYALRSKLSTITESEITVSEYSSEEFVSQENKEKKEKKKLEYLPKSYTGTGKILEGASSHSEAMYYSSLSQHPEPLHHWVCTPVEENRRFFNLINNKKYICYKK